MLIRWSWRCVYAESYIGSRCVSILRESRRHGAPYTDSVVQCVQCVSTVSTQCPPAQRALDEYRLASASCTHRHCMIISRRLDRPTEHIRTRSAPNTALLMSKSDTGCVRSSRMLSHVRCHSADHTTVSEGTPRTGHTHRQ